MKPLLCLLLACATAGALEPAPASAAGFEGRRCTPPSGHRIADCRVGRHGIPDLSRAAWRALRGAEATARSMAREPASMAKLAEPN